MNTTPEQLRLAADIIENNWPWESRYSTGQWMDFIGERGPFAALVNGREIRRKPLSFPPIPDGMTLHNPDGLTAEQVGDGWRLRTVCEAEKSSKDGGIIDESYAWLNGAWSTRGNWNGGVSDITYRVPLSTPYPDGSKIVDGKLVAPELVRPRFTVGQRVKSNGKTGTVQEHDPHSDCFRIQWDSIVRWELSKELES